MHVVQHRPSAQRWVGKVRDARKASSCTHFGALTPHKDRDQYALLSAEHQYRIAAMPATDILPPSIGPAAGLLTDHDIREALGQGYLFHNATYVAENASYATYELRVGNTFEVLHFRDDRLWHSEQRVSDDEVIPIPPSHVYRIYAKEHFLLPRNVFASVTTVSRIFSSGLAAETTYADPGFSGPFYITLSNVSTRILSLRPTSPLARVEFHKLHAPVRSVHGGAPRPNFVDASIDTASRMLLHKKSLETLVQEMVSRSLDEALQERLARSEVILTKMSANARQFFLLQTLVTVLVIALVGSVLHMTGVLGWFTTKEWPLHFMNFVIALVAGIAATFAQRRWLG